MIEVHEIIIAINRLRDKVADLASKVDFLSKSPSYQLSKKYLSEIEACRILKCSRQMLTRMRDNGEIPFYRIHRRILYQASDLHEYLEKHYVKPLGRDSPPAHIPLVSIQTRG